MWWTAFINFLNKFYKIILLFLIIAENWSKIGCAITTNSQGTSTWFSARATATGLTGKTFFFLFVLFFSFFRCSRVVRNYQAKLIRDFLLSGVVQKQMKSPMNGFILHVNNYLENLFSTKKTPSIAAKPYFSSRAYCKLKTSVAASRNITWFSKRDIQLLHYFKT